MFFIVMLPIFPQLDPNGLQQPLHFLLLQSQLRSAPSSKDQLLNVISKASSLSSPPSGSSIFNSVSDSSNHCLQRRRERIISTNRILASLERLRPKAYLSTIEYDVHSSEKSTILRLTHFDSNVNIWTIRICTSRSASIYFSKRFAVYSDKRTTTETKILSHRFEDNTFLCPISFQSELLRPSSPHIPFSIYSNSLDKLDNESDVHFAGKSPFDKLLKRECLFPFYSFLTDL